MALVDLRTNLADWSTTKKKPSEANPAPVNFFDAGGVNATAGATGFTKNFNSENASKFLGISNNNQSYTYPATVRGNRLMQPTPNVAKFPGPQNFISDSESGVKGFRLNADNPEQSAFIGVTSNNQGYVYPSAVLGNRLMKPRLSTAFPGPQNFISDSESGVKGFRLRADNPGQSDFIGISSNNQSYIYPDTVRGNRLMKPRLSAAFPGPQNFINDNESGASGFRLRATDKTQSAFLGIDGTSYTYPESVQGVQGNPINKVPVFPGQTATFEYPIGNFGSFRYSNDKNRVATQGNAVATVGRDSTSTRYEDRVKSIKGQSSLSPLFANSTKENSPSAITEQYTKFHLTDESYNPTYLAQPYIIRGIQRLGDPNPQRWGGFSTSFDDGLVPAGTVAYGERIGADVARVAQFIASPKGLLWTAKQAGLQLSNPLTENDTRVFNPIQLVANVATAPLGIRVQRHGLVGVTNTYEEVVRAKNVDPDPVLYQVPAPNGGLLYNRLLALSKEYFVGLPIRTIVGTPSITLTAPFGGPKSVYGIGLTTISRTVDSMNGDTSGNPFDGRFHGSVDYALLKKSGISDSYNDFRNEVGTTRLGLPAPPDQPNAKTIADSVIGKQGADYYNDFNLETKYGFGSHGKPARAKGASRGEGSFKVVSYNTEQNAVKLFDADSKVTRKQLADNENFYGDRINAVDVSTDRNDVLLTETEIYPTNTRDFIRFYFEDAIQGRHVIAMRATITGLSDSFSPGWSRIDILGYPAGAYSYNSFERAVSFSFTVAATSRSEMIPIWRKLNYLATYTMPDYVDNRPTGPFMRLTLGDLYKNAPGFIESLSYTVPDETTWDIADDADTVKDAKQLPTVIEVSVTYKMISNYLPQKLGAAYDLGTTKKTEGNWLQDSRVAADAS